LEFIINSKAEEFTLNVADNASLLVEQFDSHWLQWPWASNDVYKKTIIISPYGMNCIGLSYHGDSPVPFTVLLREIGKRI